MGIEKLDAIVMRTYPLRDTSRIVHLLTPQRGHIKLVAKGARAPRSRFGAALEPFTLIRVVAYYKANRDLQLLSQADILRARRVLARSVLRYAYASAVIELLEQFLGGEESSPPLFIEVDASLTTLEGVVETELRAAFMGFIVRLLTLQGYRPELDRCILCGAPPGEGMGFDAVRGGLVCRRCHCGVGGALPLPAAARELLVRLLTAGAAEPLAPALGDAVARLLEAFLRHHLPRYRRLRSLELVRAVTSRD